jgi:hypothetical protein
MDVDAIRVIVYPSFVPWNKCSGYSWFDTFPSPKFHTYPVAPILVLLKLSICVDSVKDGGFASKLACG